eukprot:scaffold5221_cov397-Prasinococcus_capsulatus_cf.AAC.7
MNSSLRSCVRPSAAAIVATLTARVVAPGSQTTDDPRADARGLPLCASPRGAAPSKYQDARSYPPGPTSPPPAPRGGSAARPRPASLSREPQFDGPPHAAPAIAELCWPP